MNYPNKVYRNILVVIISLLVTPQLFAQFGKAAIMKSNDRVPVIMTEKVNYQPNETVGIAGVDFQSYERVRITVKYFDVNNQQDLVLTSWDAYSDAKGRLFDEWQVADLGQAGSRFILTADGMYSGYSSKTEFSTDPLAGESVNLAQCANTNAIPQNMDCPPTGPAGWVSGLVGNSKARYFEGDSIAYRNVMSGMNIGKSYKWTVQYDTSKGSLNAIDYLTTYNRSILNANPCRDGANLNAFCTFASPTSTLAIPTDTKVTNGRDQTPATPDDIIQIAGAITAWGGTITAVSVPTYTPVGTFPAGDTTAKVDITFTANAATVVIAWGGHTATRTDWGQTFGSVNIGGAPYHTNNGGLMNLTDATTCCGGSQDLSLSAVALAPTARINIVKRATPFSPFAFGFTTTNLSPSSFSLVDNSNTTDPMQVFDNISTFDVKTITETNPAPYSLQSIVCVVNVGTGGTPPPVRTGNSIAIDIKSGDVVTCTFNNDFLTAAAVSVSGRVFGWGGLGLPNARVNVTDSNGNIRAVSTNQFGYYSVDELEAGGSYIFDVRHKSYTFPQQVINVDDNLLDLNFFPQ